MGNAGAVKVSQNGERSLGDGEGRWSVVRYLEWANQSRGVMKNTF